MSDQLGHDGNPGVFTASALSKSRTCWMRPPALAAEPRRWGLPVLLASNMPKRLRRWPKLRRHENKNAGGVSGSETGRKCRLLCARWHVMHHRHDRFSGRSLGDGSGWRRRDGWAGDADSVDGNRLVCSGNTPADAGSGAPSRCDVERSASDAQGNRHCGRLAPVISHGD